MITKTYQLDPSKECAWRLTMWAGTPSERTIGVFGAEAKAKEIAHAMKKRVNAYAEYDINLFYLDVAPVDFDAIKR
jgi:hypothetical protein